MFKKHRTGAVPCCSSRCFDCMETDELRLGTAAVAFSPECHGSPCCPHCKGWKTRMRMNCKKSLPNRTPRTCTTSRNLSWCTRWWRAWPEPSAPGWKNRTGRSKVKRVTRAAILCLWVWPEQVSRGLWNVVLFFTLAFSIESSILLRLEIIRLEKRVDGRLCVREGYFTHWIILSTVLPWDHHGFVCVFVFN